MHEGSQSGLSHGIRIRQWSCCGSQREYCSSCCCQYRACSTSPFRNQHLQMACHPGVWARNCAAELNPTASLGRPQGSPLPHDLVAGPVSAVLVLRTSAAESMAAAESTSPAEQVGSHQSQNWCHCPDFHPPHSARRASSEVHPNDPASPQSKVRAPLHQWHVVCACVELQTFCICMA